MSSSSRNPQMQTAAREYAEVCTFLPLLIAAMVLGGWFFKVEALYRWLPEGPAMVVNTAVGVILLGTALLTHFKGRPWSPDLMAGAAMALGATSLAQYFFKVDLGVDQLLWRYDAALFRGPPGRLPIPTACSLVLLGGAVISLRRFPGGAAGVVGACLGSAVAGLVTLTSISFALGLEAGSLSGMAVPTIIAILLLAFAVLFEAWHGYPRLEWSLPLSTAGLVVFTAIGAAMVSSNNQLKIGHRWVEHTLLVRERLNELALHLADAHLGERIYFRTGDEAFASSVERNAALARGSIKELEPLTRDNPSQFARLTELSRLVEEDYASLHDFMLRPRTPETLEQDRRRQDQESIPKRQVIRRLIEEMLAGEARLLAVRSAEAEKLSRQTTMMSGLGGGGAIFLLVTAAWVTARLAKKRRQTQAQLEASNQALEVELVERRRLQQEYKLARDQALEASRFKSEFLANMSHELRTPMNGIIGMTELLMKSELDEEQREMNGVVLQSADALLEIINDILDFSKIEAGRMTIHEQPFNPKQTAEDCIALLASRAHAKGVELIFDAPPDFPRQLLGDAGRIRQIIMNLAGNAIKFTARGEVCVSMLPLGDQVEKEGKFRFRVEVRDTGEGIPAAAQASLFQPFVQADASTTRTHGGTGLGLAICRQLIELMGGKIGFESEFGKGSNFWFELALTQAADEAPASDFQDTLAGHRILIVDDNANNLRIVARQIAAMGADSVCAASGAEAMTALKRQDTFGAVVLDWLLPDYDGTSLARDIRALNLPHPPRLILMSSTDSHTEKSTVPLFDVQLVKPVREAHLRRCICRLLGGQAPAEMSSTSAPREDGQPLGPSLDLLIVEDNKANQAVLSKLLNKLGHKVTIAENGEACLKILNSRTFDCIFMDCQMPVMDGYETTTRIRSGEDTGLYTRMPIVALTANALPAERLRCMSVGMDDFITKPVRSKDLVEVIERCTALPALAQ